MKISQADASTSTPAVSIKRPRSPTPNNDALLEAHSDKPNIPRLNGVELILQVFTHKSLRRPDVDPNADLYDNERLSDLGEKVLEAAVTHCLFNKRPILTVGEMTAHKQRILSDANLERWAIMYGLKEKLRCHPDVFPLLSTPEAARLVFDAYTAGVYLESGMRPIHRWMDQLIRQLDGQHFRSAPRPPTVSLDPPPPSKKAKVEPESRVPIFFASQPPSPKLPNPLTPAQPDLPFLPFFNQAASNRRVKVEYFTEFLGPVHAGQWIVKCVVNGLQKGVGTGGTKQTAKESAARQAYHAMGWAPSG